MGNDLFDQTRPFINKAAVNLDKTGTRCQFFPSRHGAVDTTHTDNGQGAVEGLGQVADHLGALVLERTTAKPAASAAWGMSYIISRSRVVLVAMTPSIRFLIKEAAT